MANPDYEYYGLKAESWDLLRGDTSGWPDRPFYLNAIRRHGQPALDIGCGTGRLLLDYRAAGIDIDGVDDSPEMLGLCREKADAALVDVELILQPMERMVLPRRYRTILIPSSSLQLLVDPKAALETLKRVREALEPGGVVYASIMTLWKQGQPAEQAWEESAVAGDGSLIRRIAITRFDPIDRLEYTEDRYEKIVDGNVVRAEVHVRSPATRSYTQEQAVQLFERSEFESIDVLKAFEDVPAGRGDSLFVIRAFRPRNEASAETAVLGTVPAASFAADPVASVPPPVAQELSRTQSAHPAVEPDRPIPSSESTTATETTGVGFDFRLGDNDT